MLFFYYNKWPFSDSLFKVTLRKAAFNIKEITCGISLYLPVRKCLMSFYLRCFDYSKLVNKWYSEFSQHSGLFKIILYRRKSHSHNIWQFNDKKAIRAV